MQFNPTASVSKASIMKSVALLTKPPKTPVKQKAAD